jgi:hypothetical protein
MLPEIPDEPLEYQWMPKAVTQIPAEMVAALAQGLEEPADIALRCGFTPEQWSKLQDYKPLQVAVAAKKAELEKDGWVVRQKAAMGADMLLDQVIVQAMSNDTSLGAKLEVFKTLVKVGNLEPKDDKQASAGPGFQISINLGDHSVQIGQGAPTIDAVAVELPAPRVPRNIDILDLQADLGASE